MKTIKFNAYQVSEIVRGVKTVTRRPLKTNHRMCPYTVGELYAIREPWAKVSHSPSLSLYGLNTSQYDYVYASDGYETVYEACKGLEKAFPPRHKVNTTNETWQPPEFMPLGATRWAIKPVQVVVEKLHSITDGGVRAEGVTRCFDMYQDKTRSPLINGFVDYWDIIYGAGEYCWQNNPSVWAIEFEAFTCSFDPTWVPVLDTIPIGRSR